MKRAFLFTLAFVFAAPVYARDTIELQDRQESVPLEGHIQYALFETDPGIDQLSQGEMEESFKPVGDKTLNLGVKKEICYLSFDLTNRMSHRSQWFLEIGYPPLDYIDVYLYKEGRLKYSARGGDLFPFRERQIKHRNTVFDFSLDANETVTVFIRVKTDSIMQIPMSLWTPRSFLAKDHEEQIVFGIYYGILLVMLIYNLFIFITVRDMSYLYYVFFIFFLLLIVLSFNGHAYEYIWPTLVEWNNRSIVFLASLGYSSAIMYTRTLLNTKNDVPRLDLALRVLIVLTGLLFVAAFFFNYALLVRIGGLLGILDSIGIIAAGYIRFIHRYKPARIFILAWSLFVLASILLMLRTTGLFGTNFLSVYGFQIFSAVLVILLSFALADKINLITQEKEDAQAEAIVSQKRELDSRLRLMNAFYRFVPGEFLKFLEKDNIIEVELGDAVLKNMTVLFSDIRDFTSLSEEMTPEENFKFLNSFLKRMEPSIDKHCGFVDKFIGDAIMALFSDEPEEALNAAIDMRRELVLYNQFRVERDFKPIEIGIGINSGEVMLGTVGSSNRLDTTVIGNAVNLAARLESLTKIFKIPIIISDIVYRKLKNPNIFFLREIDMVAVKGRKDPVLIYECFDMDPPELRELKRNMIPELTAGLALYKMGKFDRALQRFEHCQEMTPGDNIPAIYIHRCTEFLKHPPGEEWTGITILAPA